MIILDIILLYITFGLIISYIGLFCYIKACEPLTPIKIIPNMIRLSLTAPIDLGYRIIRLFMEIFK